MIHPVKGKLYRTNTELTGFTEDEKSWDVRAVIPEGGIILFIKPLKHTADGYGHCLVIFEDQFLYLIGSYQKWFELVKS